MKSLKFYSSLFLLGAGGLLSNIHGAESPAAASAAAEWQKPAWLTDLSLGVKESYDDNLLLVSGNGLSPQSSWVTTVSSKIGFNFAPLLGNQKTLQTLSLVYAPDFNIYENAPSQNYDAHKIGGMINGPVR